MNGRFVRLAEQGRRTVSLTVDGAAVEALQGDTLMVALLTQGNALRQSEFDSGRRAGFCLMGACQDCWVMTTTGERLRSCATFIQAGMQLTTGAPA